MQQAFKVALFDLDGVVLDTETQYSRFWGAVGRDYHPGVADFAQRIKGQTLVEIFGRWFAGDDAAQAAITHRLNAYEAAMDYPYIKGTRAYVEALRRRGVATAVVTSSNVPKMDNVRRHHPEMAYLFDHIFTSEDVTASKPAPDCYLLGARHFGAAPQECVVFEDSVNGLRAGRAAGCYVVGLATTNPRPVVAALADLVVDDFTSPLLP
ncbi:MAG: HAD family phosphatase [Bacteroidaceae bacterium]|nr:HAD family phosphatase [Bacteroidaceae bacterium]